MFRSHSRGRHESSPVGGGEIPVARAFYDEVLRGQQVWPTGCSDDGRSLWFLVGGTLVEVDPKIRGAATSIALEVDDPGELAERCWDAGFRVRVREDTVGGVQLSVIDPFGRQIDLVRRDSEQRVARCG
jgi:hypothetical protein